MSDVLFIPFPKNYYDALVRYSNGRLDPSYVAQLAVERWVGTNAMDPTEWFLDCLDDRARELIEIISPDELQYWDELNDRFEKRIGEEKALIWKEVTVPHGAAVRMAYKGIDYTARVENGAIVEDGVRYSPSEWASHIAEGTQRNAWRDLHFLLPNSQSWTAASTLRKEQRARIKAALQNLDF